MCVCDDSVFMIVLFKKIHLKRLYFGKFCLLEIYIYPMALAEVFFVPVQCKAAVQSCLNLKEIGLLMQLETRKGKQSFKSFVMHLYINDCCLLSNRERSMLMQIKIHFWYSEQYRSKVDLAGMSA